MSDKKQLRALVNKANKRLERLEKNEHVNWAYKLAPMDADGEHRRFRIPKNASSLQIRSLEKKLNRFLEAKTSTITGIEEVRHKRIDTMLKNNPDLPTNLDREKLSDFLSSKQFEQLKKYADSGQIIEKFVEMADRQSADDIIYEFDRWLETSDTPFNEAFEILE